MEFYFVKYATQKILNNGSIILNLHLRNGGKISRVTHKKEKFDSFLVNGKRVEKVYAQYFTYFQDFLVSDKVNTDLTNQCLNLDDFEKTIVVTQTVETKYGKQFGEIRSINFIEDFRRELESHQGGNFISEYPIYEFLKFMTYHVNNDNTINLKHEYSDYFVDKNNYCYKKHLDSTKYVTNSNLKLIYRRFYEGVVIEGRNTDTTYSLSSEGIICHRSFEQTQGKIKFSRSMVCKIGAKLTIEQEAYLASL